ncbi:hypothetical protein [Peribacillus huizhouensis]|uniref:Uncharacterized protein n=1 Tax=Peribacillus huizhouensis TaxID=1501239 RepID=A0ABR6CKR5_9BACI|nr:hypothetical protein [Peribacillus huizhouensis]MBA9025125.1 hypothetical protein [Peribacillus huizhouensis]
MQKDNKNLVILSSSIVLLVVLNFPSSAVYSNDFITSEPIESALELASHSDIEQAKALVAKALTMNENATYTLNHEQASLLGYTEDQVNQLTEVFESFTPEEVAYINEQISAKPVDIPLIPIDLSELIAILTALGLAGIAQQFILELYKNGLTQACKRFSRRNKYIKNFCKNNKYPTSM